MHQNQNRLFFLNNQLIKSCLDKYCLFLYVLLKEILNQESIKELKSDLQKMFLNYMCSDEAEASIDRQCATVSFLKIKKILDTL